MQPPVKTNDGIRAWLPVIGLALAAFVFNTSEFLPVGLLPEIAKSLHASVEHTGLVITGYAWVVSLMSLPMTVLTTKIERRRLLLILIACFAASHFLVLWATTFMEFFASRICVALTHSIFWSIMTPLAARMAPRGKHAYGLAAVQGGTIIATVLGVPIGTLLGQWFGWRESFFIVGIAATLVWVMVFATLPLAPSAQAGSLKSLPIILKRPGLIQLYLLTAVTMLGQFTVYSFISPILQHVGGLPASEIANVLFTFGIAGIIGTVISTKFVDKHLSATVILPLLLITCATLALVLTLKSSFLLYPTVVIWGAGMTAICMAYQTILLKVAGDAADVATSLYSGIFNIGIGGGAALGGFVAAHWGFVNIGYTGSFFIGLCALVCVLVLVLTGHAILGMNTVKTKP